MNALKLLVNNPFKKKKVFIGKEKKITINILTTFFIFHKNNVKTFLKLIINQYKAFASITHSKNTKHP